MSHTCHPHQAAWRRRWSAAVARLLRLSLLLPALPLVSCETDNYEKGEGKYSLMRADLGTVTIDADKYATDFTTDDGDRYTLAPPFTAAWIETADTTYRTLLYYNKVNDTQAEPVAAGSVLTLLPREQWRFERQPMDPLGVESSWLSGDGRYINLGLLVKSGRVDDEEGTQALDVAQDTVLTHSDARRTAYYRLLHDQMDVPQYYTNRRFVSILLPTERPDTVRLTIETFEGPVERLFVTAR